MRLHPQKLWRCSGGAEGLLDLYSLGRSIVAKILWAKHSTASIPTWPQHASSRTASPTAKWPSKPSTHPACRTALNSGSSRSGENDGRVFHEALSVHWRQAARFLFFNAPRAPSGLRRETVSISDFLVGARKPMADDNETGLSVFLVPDG